MSIKRIGIFSICIGASLLVGYSGSVFTMPQIEGWYAYITKPSWTPPNWVFGPVWTVLYVLMGSAAALVWVKGRKHARLALLFFALHLFVNWYWSYVFFVEHHLDIALVVISTLWAMILAMMIWFKKYSRVAPYLLVPYLVWVSYASTLNLGTYLLNH